MITRAGSVVRAGAVSLALSACGGAGSTSPVAAAAAAPGGTKDQSQWPTDDRSMCDWKNKAELEVSETAGPGALRPNVRRVFKSFGENESRRKSLICREIDTNLDGIKDVVRHFNAKGEAIREEADRDYDGRIDLWINFVDGRLAQEDVDSNGDGRPDVWKFYVNGQLQRVRRDRNFDGKADIWEIFARGRLERVGLDDSYDGHVDRWDRDEQLKYEAEAADRKARDEMANAEMAARSGRSGADAGAGVEPGPDRGKVKDTGAAPATKPTPTKPTAPSKT